MYGEITVTENLIKMHEYLIVFVYKGYEYIYPKKM